MALNAQVSSNPSLDDFPFFNYGATDIPAFVTVKVDPANTVGAGQEGIGITLTSNTTDGDTNIGVTTQIIKAGTSGLVRTAGLAVCIADGAITAGSWVYAAGADAGKVGYVKLDPAASSKPTVGLALSTAVDGDQVLVMLNTGRNS